MLVDQRGGVLTSRSKSVSQRPERVYPDCPAPIGEARCSGLRAEGADFELDEAERFCTELFGIISNEEPRSGATDPASAKGAGVPMGCRVRDGGAVRVSTLRTTP